ncbi:FMN-binding protein [Anaeromicrobium sediminis]|uniref:FMN-binding protein n=1 Tax=Anaeromicrobium sediminis TaxID=1478221 RepID=A0A267MFK7_9FIRM|nr:FMN-binding protein [Anaeromicrobium sediminis]PAB58359.1 FMN-binding protein [Anaeromicrobium sediminis]
MKKIGLIRKIIQTIAFLPITVIALNNQTYFSVFILILTAIGGAFYCGYLCPFGFLQEIVSIIGNKLKIKKKTVPPKLNSILKLTRYILYILVTVLSVSAIFILLRYDARSNLYLVLIGKQINYAMIISVIMFCTLSLFYKKPFCNYFCIKGAEYGLLSIFRVFSIKRNTKSCVNCKLCDRACEMGITVSTCNSVNSMNCINCFECIKKCPIKNTLTFGLVQPNLLKKKVAFAVLIGAIYVGALHSDYFLKTSIVDANVKAVETSKIVEETTKEPEVDNATYYIGEANGYNDLIKVKVGIEEGVITKISIVDHDEDWDWYTKAKGPIIDAILEKQSADVDTVSGATFTSTGIIEAVKKALEGAEFNK